MVARIMWTVMVIVVVALFASIDASEIQTIAFNFSTEVEVYEPSFDADDVSMTVKKAVVGDTLSIQNADAVYKGKEYDTQAEADKAYEQWKKDNNKKTVYTF